MTNAETLQRNLSIYALTYIWAATDASRVRIVRGAQELLDRESGLTESGKLSIWMGELRRARRSYRKAL